jgi:hypothetical protein
MTAEVSAATPAAGEVRPTARPLRVAAETLIANRTALAGVIVIVAMLGFSFIGRASAWHR